MQLNSNQKIIAKKIVIALIMCAALVVAYAIGTYVVLPGVTALQEYNAKFLALILGSVVVGVLFLILRSVAIAEYNRMQEMNALTRVPKTFRDIQKLGIHSPIDYCATMQILFAYSKIPNLGFPSPFMKESTNPETWEEAIKLFRLTFGRDPYGVKNDRDFNWGYLTACEAQVALEKPSVDLVTSEEVMKLLSPEVISNLGVSLI